MKVKNIMFFGFAAAILSAGAASAEYSNLEHYGALRAVNDASRKIVTSKAYVDTNTNQLAEDISDLKGTVSGLDGANIVHNGDNISVLNNNAGYLTESDLTDDFNAKANVSLNNIDAAGQTVIDNRVVAKAKDGSFTSTEGLTSTTLGAAIDEVQGNIPTIPTNVSSFTNDAGYLTEHQDITGKANVSLNNIDAAGQTVIDNRVVAKAAEGTYSNTTSGLAATNIQAAIDEIAGDVSALDGANIVHDGDNVSVLTNDAGYITSAAVKDGTLTINSGRTGNAISNAYTANSENGATVTINDVPAKPAQCTDTNPCALVTDDTGNWIWLAMAQPGA